MSNIKIVKKKYFLFFLIKFKKKIFRRPINLRNLGGVWFIFSVFK